MAQPDLRPLGIGEILDGAFTLYRRNFATFFATAVIPQLPVIAFWTLVPPTALSDPEQADALSGAMFGVLYPYSTIATLLVWGALTHQVAEAYAGGRGAGIREGYGHAFRRMLPLLVAGAVSVVAIFVGMMLFLVPGILVAIMLFGVVPAIIVEHAGPFAALRRSRRLAKGAWGRVFGIMFLAVTIAAMPNLAVWVTAGVGAAFAGPDALAGLESGWTYAAAQATSGIVGALTTPFVVGSIVLLYYDRRVRTEALDLELAADDAAAEPAH